METAKENQHRILIADDEEIWRLPLADKLRNEGYYCDCAEDSDSALKLIEENGYDLLIADIRMPGNNNLELIQYLADHCPGLPVILLTAWASVETAMASIQLPVAGYFRKTDDFENLLEQIRICLKKSQVTQIINQSKNHLDLWRQNLDTITTSNPREPETSAYVATNAFISLTLHNIMGSLNDLRGLTEIYAGIAEEKYVCQLFSCPRAVRLTAGIKETLRIIEATKKSFKSKELAELKKKLEALLQHEGM